MLKPWYTDISDHKHTQNSDLGAAIIGHCDVHVRVIVVVLVKVLFQYGAVSVSISMLSCVPSLLCPQIWHNPAIGPLSLPQLRKLIGIVA